MYPTSKFYELKADLKVKAVELRDLKKTVKETQRAGEIADAAGLQYAHFLDKKKYRIRHIAYCLLKGRKYEEIERFTREPLEKHHWDQIEEIRRTYAENVCADAA